MRIGFAVAQFDVAVVAAGVGAGDRQPQARARRGDRLVRADPFETRERALAQDRVQPRAIVGHGDFRAVFLAADGHGDASAHGRVVDGVVHQVRKRLVQFGLVARDRHGRLLPFFGAGLHPSQVLLLIVRQRQVLQHHFARHGVHVQQLPRQRVGLVGMRQRQQLFGEAAGAAQLIDDAAQAFLRPRRIPFAQRILRLRQHDGQRRAQLVGRVRQEVRLFVQHPAVAGDVVVDGVDQRGHFAGHARRVQRRQVVGAAPPDVVAQPAQRLQRPGHAPPDQQHHQRQHAGIAQDFLAPRAVLGLDALAGAFGHDHQHLAVLPLVVQVPHHRDDPHGIVAVDAVVENRLAIGTRPVGRARHFRHAQQGLARVRGHRRAVRQGRIDFLDAEVLAQARPGFEHHLRIERRGDLELAVGREFEAAFQDARGLHQRAVVGLVGDFGQRAVVVQAVHDQQHHHARQQQDDEQRANADARQPGYPQAQADSLATLSSM